MMSCILTLITGTRIGRGARIMLYEIRSWLLFRIMGISFLPHLVWRKWSIWKRFLGLRRDRRSDHDNFNLWHGLMFHEEIMLMEVRGKCSYVRSQSFTEGAELQKGHWRKDSVKYVYKVEDTPDGVKQGHHVTDDQTIFVKGGLLGLVNKSSTPGQTDVVCDLSIWHETVPPVGTGAEIIWLSTASKPAMAHLAEIWNMMGAVLLLLSVEMGTPEHCIQFFRTSLTFYFGNIWFECHWAKSFEWAWSAKAVTGW